MFIVTARVPRKKLLAGAIAVFCCCLVLTAALIVTRDDRTVTTAAQRTSVRSNEGRVAYLGQLGWQVEETPVLIEELIIPEVFDESYDAYLDLQSRQGFDLTKYCGMRVKRYIYNVTNYPENRVSMQAALLICRNNVVGGQLQAADGSLVLPLTGAK